MQLNRRTFIRTTALAGASLPVFGHQVFSKPRLTNVRVAYVSDTADQPVPYPADWVTSTLYDPTDKAPFNRLLNRADVDLLVADLAPRHRTAVALAAMQAGKAIAFTAPVGQTINDIMRLVQMHRQTGVHCLVLDDDGADRDILAADTMIQQGQFGDLTYVQCGTASATNGLLMAMNWLAINRGNAFKTLNASIAKSWGLHQPGPELWTENNEPTVRNYELGEVLTITLQCTNGQLVSINHDLAGIRPHERGFRVQGTAGYWMQDNDVVMRRGKSESFSAVKSQFTAGQAETNALSALTTSLQHNTIQADATLNALTVGLVHAVAKLSLAAWGDDLDVPSLTLSV